jgi:hypothetical protein
VNKVLAIFAMAVVAVLLGLSQPLSAGQDGPGQSAKTGPPPHQTVSPLIPFGQDGPGQ